MKKSDMRTMTEEERAEGARMMQLMFRLNHTMPQTPIGAMSVVTKDVPDFAVVVGSPAKVVKMLDPEGFEKRKTKNEQSK